MPIGYTQKDVSVDPIMPIGAQVNPGEYIHKNFLMPQSEQSEKFGQLKTFLLEKLNNISQDLVDASPSKAFQTIHDNMDIVDKFVDTFM